MSQISINQSCGDGCAEQVTINVNCTCKPTQPPAPQPRLTEASLYGFATCTVLPQYCTFKVTPTPGPYLMGATAILPAGVSLASIGVAVLEPGVGEMSHESRVAVYVGGVAEKAGQSLHLPELFTGGTGWRWANLDKPVMAAEEDRPVWLVAQVPSFTTHMPTFLSCAATTGFGFVNGLRPRNVLVQGAAQLPQIFEADAVPFTPRPEIPLMAGVSYPIVKP
ncbi:hypothetical protein [Nonomuraea dietziae]|uniref:hypothetical protein n=1 Tax=Nonomuraea dietziae TaxID=65515 RepID=UPI0033FCAB05